MHNAGVLQAVTKSSGHALSAEPDEACRPKSETKHASHIQSNSPRFSMLGPTHVNTYGLHWVTAG